jgi:hypothetical protein
VILACAIERGHRGKGATFEGGAELLIVGGIELAHFVIEFELAQTLHRKSAIVFETIDLEPTDALTTPTAQPLGKGRRDEQCDRRDDHDSGHVSHHG